LKILGIEHIGIATESIDKIAPFWRQVLKLDRTHREIVEREGVITDIYDTGRGKVELLEQTGQESSIAKFLKKKGSGIHHICLEVENIEEAISELKQADIQLINDVPLKGAEENRVVFIHPKSTGGVLVELAQKPK
jgi:methylmalonyl-CoA/ethylmalonyl-CoA epimerase|tara:strand:- start:66 stop:473 length:408 start_codon:yes stop_codon:yes gene_type:complete